MKCPICSRKNEGPTDDGLARHLMEVHGMESLRAGCLAQRARHWAEYEVQLRCGDLVEDRFGALTGICL
jgi:hypothetical protein